MKIPPDAKLVYKGIIFDVYQWQQKMFDESFQTFERIRRPDTVDVICVAEGKVLLIENEQPDRGKLLALPGGRVDKGEETLAAAKRELLEETGLESTEWEYLRSYAPVAKLEWNVHYFVARNPQRAATPAADAGERITLKPVSFDEFIALVSSENFQGKDLSADILRMRLDPPKLEEFRRRILGNP